MQKTLFLQCKTFFLLNVLMCLPLQEVRCDMMWSSVWSKVFNDFSVEDINSWLTNRFCGNFNNPLLIDTYAREIAFAPKSCCSKPTLALITRFSRLRQVLRPQARPKGSWTSVEDHVCHLKQLQSVFSCLKAYDSYDCQLALSGPHFTRW